jgi:hypothetical protein
MARFTRAGVAVDVHYEEDKGHETPGAATLDAFQAWLRNVIR